MRERVPARAREHVRVNVGACDGIGSGSESRDVGLTASDHPTRLEYVKGLRGGTDVTARKELPCCNVSITLNDHDRGIKQESTGSQSCRPAQILTNNFERRPAQVLGAKYGNDGYAIDLHRF